MYVCMHVCTKSFLKTTTNSSCVCTHLANKADSDSDSDSECIMAEQPPCRTGQDWDKISGKEISHSSRPSHTPTTNSETMNNPFFLYGITFKKKG